MTSPHDCLYKAGLSSQVLLPSDREYAERESSYWTSDARLGPACIVRPRSAEEVSAALKALVAADQQFAVRSGGHSVWAGASNIAGGVTIDLGLLNHVRVDTSTETAEIGPGCRWRDVYRELEKHDYTVAGGREAGVGVAGFLLGGGMAFLNSRRGLACDDIVEYQVVLSDGRIVIASKGGGGGDEGQHADLFRALKGGSNNFGIVTNFKMNMLSNNRIWGGLGFSSKEAIPASIDAMHDFTTAVPEHPDETAWTLTMYQPEVNKEDIIVLTAYASMVGAERAPAFQKFLAMPTFATQLGFKTVSEFTTEYQQSSHWHVIWFTLSFKNDKRIMTKAADLHTTLVAELKTLVPDGNFTAQCVFQPLPTLFGERSRAAGGNVVGLDRARDDGILFMATALFQTAELRKLAYPKVKALTQELKEFAQTVDGGLQDWVYLNYADPSQDPLASYGEENVRFMEKVSAEYDAPGVFQKLCPGGFKLSTVEPV